MAEPLEMMKWLGYLIVIMRYEVGGGRYLLMRSPLHSVLTLASVDSFSSHLDHNHQIILIIGTPTNLIGQIADHGIAFFPLQFQIITFVVFECFQMKYQDTITSGR